MFWLFAFHFGETLRKQEWLKCNLKQVVRFRSGAETSCVTFKPCNKFTRTSACKAEGSVTSQRASTAPLACCSPRGGRESDTTEWLDWTEWVFCRGRTSLFYPFTQPRTFVLFLVWGNYEQRCYRCFCTGFVWKRVLILSSKYPGARLWSHVAAGSEPAFPSVLVFELLISHCWLPPLCCLCLIFIWMLSLLD